MTTKKDTVILILRIGSLNPIYTFDPFDDIFVLISKGNDLASLYQ